MHHRALFEKITTQACWKIRKSSNHFLIKMEPGFARVDQYHHIRDTFWFMVRKGATSFILKEALIKSVLGLWLNWVHFLSHFDSYAYILRVHMYKKDITHIHLETCKHMIMIMETSLTRKAKYYIKIQQKLIDLIIHCCYSIIS